MSLSIRENQALFQALPIEIFLAILAYVNPKDILPLMLVDKYFYTTLKSDYFWRDEFKKCFPFSFQWLNKRAQVNWYEESKELSLEKNLNKEKEITEIKIRLEPYGESSDIRKIAQSIEAGDVGGLKQYLLKANRSSIYSKFIDWARSFNQQPILDYFYELAFKESQDPYDVIENLNLAVTCRQPISILDSLIKQGAKIDPKNFSQKPITKAISSGYVKAFAFFLNYGVSVSSEDCLPSVAALHEEDDTELVLEKKNVNKINIDANKIGEFFYHAIQVGSLEILQILVLLLRDLYNLGINRTAININSSYYSKSPLYHAVQKRDVEIINFLIAEGASIDFTVLFKAASSNLKIFSIMLDHGAKITEVNASGETLLFGASSPDILKFLIDSGLDVNHTNKRGGTPFIRAVNRELGEAAAILFETGADVATVEEKFLHLLISQEKYHSFAKALETDLFKELDISIYQKYRKEICDAFIEEIKKDPEHGKERLDKVISKVNNLGFFFAASPPLVTSFQRFISSSLQGFSLVNTFSMWQASNEMDALIQLKNNLEKAALVPEKRT